MTITPFDVCDDALYVENNGSFRDEDFDRMERLASRGKREEQDTTGAFGIGFISVYQITDKPEITSSGRKWVIVPEKNGEIDETNEPNEGNTLFRFPWAFNPNSELRRMLQLNHITNEIIETLKHELLITIPSAILFLRKLDKVEVKANGELIRTIERIVEGDNIVVQDNASSHLWFLYRGDFEDEATRLKNEFHGKIESKRESNVTIAFPEASHSADGILCAFLPTDHKTHLPFHVNADFYPSSDRKRIRFEDSVAGDWNLAALKAAATIVAHEIAGIRDNIGHQGLWQFISQIHDVYEQAIAGKCDECFSHFWERMLATIRQNKLVYTSQESWVFPDNAYLLCKEEEQEHLQLFHDLGLSIVHPDLRPYSSLLRSNQIGVSTFNLSVLASELVDVGLDKPVYKDNAPLHMGDREQRDALSNEIDLLIQKQGQSEKTDCLSNCCILLAEDKYLRAPSALKKTSQQTRDLFAPFIQPGLFVSADNPFTLLSLVQPFRVDDALEILERTSPDTLNEIWTNTRDRIISLIEWFSEPVQTSVTDLSQRARSLKIWPSEGKLHSLNELVMPGDFDDPIGFSHVLDMEYLKEQKSFLVSLGVKQLTLEEYAGNLIPEAFSSGRQFNNAEIRKLVDILAKHLGELKDIPGLQEQLSQCELADCGKHGFRKPTEAYFKHDIIEVILGPDVAYLELPEHRTEAVIDLMKWLGVVDTPRPEDIVSRVKSITAGNPRGPSRKSIEKIVQYLGTKWEDDDNWKQKLGLLKTLKWLPALNDWDNWYDPSDLYSDYQKYLFETQALFLDVKKQRQIEPIIKFLGIESNPTTELVV
ncbi:MAG: hypothetical protein ACTSV2_15965, partial [Candidatus Thorarchaeota archaeon]